MDTIQQITILDKVFNDIKEVKKYCSKILAEAEIDQRLSAENEVFILEVFKNYHPKGSNIGKQCKGIFVRQPENTTIRVFSMLYKNGMEFVTSIKKCFQTELSYISDVFRGEIHPEMTKFKKKQERADGTFICALSGKVLSWQDAQVDHFGKMEFKDIVAAFIKDNEPGAVKINEKGRRQFIDREYAEDFIEFHNSKVQLRILDIKINRNIKYRKLKELNKLVMSLRRR